VGVEPDDEVTNQQPMTEPAVCKKHTSFAIK